MKDRRKLMRYCTFMVAILAAAKTAYACWDMSWVVCHTGKTGVQRNIKPGYPCANEWHTGTDGNGSVFTGVPAQPHTSTWSFVNSRSSLCAWAFQYPCNGQTETETVTESYVIWEVDTNAGQVCITP